MDWLRHDNRKIIAGFIALALTIFIAEFYLFPNSLWLILASFLMFQTTRGTPLRQGLIIFSLLVCAIVSAIILQWILPPNFILLVIVTVAVLSGYLLWRRAPFTLSEFMLIALFPLILLIALLEPASHVVPDTRILYALIGASMGLIANITIAKVNFEKEFRRGLYPVVTSLKNYSQRLRVSATSNEFQSASTERASLDQAIIARHCFYPEWVFEIGFNHSLRAGFRFVLLQLDHIIASMLALDYTASQPIAHSHLSEIREALNESLQKNTELLALLEQYLANKTFPRNIENFTQDIETLEVETKKLLPANLELIDLKDDYPLIAALVRDIVDIRKMLIQLIAALPTS